MAVGFGVLLLVLLVLMPDVFAELEKTLLAFLNVLESIFALSSEVLENAPASLALPTDLPTVQFGS